MARRRGIVVAAVLAPAFLFPALLAGPGMAEVRIAVAGPMTGPNAAYGDQMRRGAEAAVADINAAGGVNGETAVLVVGDDASDGRQGVALAADLVADGVVAVMGHFNSHISIPASAVYAEEGIVMISPASTSPELTERGLATVFRTCNRDDQQGIVMGAYLAEAYAGRRVAIVHDRTAYGKGLADATRAVMNAAGLEETLYAAVAAGDRDFTALISRMKAERIEAIYYGGLHNEAALIVRQAREQGLDARFISGDGIVTTEYWAIAGAAAEGTLMTFGAVSPDMPSARAVTERFRAAGYEPEGYTLYTYAAVEAWAQAAERAGTFDGETVAATLKDGTEWQTVIGPLPFDEKGDRAVPNYIFYAWHDGAYMPVDPPIPAP